MSSPFSLHPRGSLAGVSPIPTQPCCRPLRKQCYRALRRLCARKTSRGRRTELNGSDWDNLGHGPPPPPPPTSQESWNQNAVPKGAVLQPLYALMSDFLQMDPEMPKLKKPLELKVQVLFGEVVGACLNTHPMFLWVTRDGAVIQWDPATPGLLKKGHGFWEDLPGAILQLLLRCLAEHWHSLRRDSEQLAVGLDELRVDWLLGDDFWGPRIGELTYMGTMAVDVAPISWRLARAFAAGHLGRCKKQALEPFG